MYLIINCLHDVKFEFLYRLYLKLPMTNFLEDGLHLERVYVLVFAGQEHARDTHNVEVLYLQNIRRVFEESVHDRHGEEESEVVAFEVG